MSERLIIRIMRPVTFRFLDPASPCSYWTGGAHIVADGKCRCGAEFVLARKEPQLYEVAPGELVH